MSFACPFQMTGCYLANIPGDISSKNCLENFVYDVLTSYVCHLHVHFTYVFFWDEVKSKKI